MAGTRVLRSPWDRNHPDYARPEYLTYYRNQLLAVMFSDAGPDIRWVGNEHGVAFETIWMALNRHEIYPGFPDFAKYAPGQPDGSDWVPPEVDVSIRPGWFYHPAEDTKVKTVQQLLDIYYASVGRSANLLLNLPPDRRGLIHETDVERLLGLRRIVDATFKTDLARNARIHASHTRGNDAAYAAAHLNDGALNSYWASDDTVTTATLTVEFDSDTTVSHVLIREHAPLGQRVEKWNVEAELESKWQPVAEATTIGYRRILKFEPVIARRLRINILESRACPVISTVSLF